MNGISGQNVTYTPQPTNSGADTSGVTELLELLQAGSVIAVIIAIIVFVLWVCSLIAIIEISGTLKQMREDALLQNLPEADDIDPGQKRTVQPLSQDELDEISEARKHWFAKKIILTRTTIILLSILGVATLLFVILYVWLV